MVRKLLTMLGLLGVSLLGACQDNPTKPTYHVDDAAAPSADAEAKRLHAMQAIKVFNPNLPVDQQYQEWEASTLTWQVRELCEVRHYCQTGVVEPNCDDAFLRAACDLTQEMCVAETLNEIAEAAVVPVPLEHTMLFERFVIPPQSEPARLAILNEVRFYAQRVAIKAMSVLGGSFYDPANPYAFSTGVPTTCDFAAGGSLVSSPSTALFFQPDTAPWADADGRRVSQIVTAALVSGERLSRSATFAAAEKTVAIAEWDRGSVNSLPLATERAYSGAQVSRAAAAHMLVGGDPGLRIQTDLDPATGAIPTSPAFCMAAALTPSGKRALQALRLSGIDPNVILGSTTTSALISGPLSSGSVQDRLPYVRPGVALSPFEEFAATIEDFKEARSYLGQEIVAFNRTRTAVLDDLGGTYARYAGVSPAVPRRPDSFYSAIARQLSNANLDGSAAADPDVLSAPGFYDLPVISRSWSYNATKPNDLATFYGQLIFWLNTSLSYYTEPSETVPGERRIFGEVEFDVRPLFLLLQRLRTESKAAVGISPYNGSCSDPECSGVHMEVLTSNPYPALSFVAGEDGISCAIDGKVEGGSCFGTGTVDGVLGTVGVGDLRFALNLFPPDPTTTLFPKRMYLYGLGSSGRNEIVASLPALNLNHANHNDIGYAYAVIPEIEQKVAEFLRPSDAWCTHAEVECNGQRFDARLPMENELNDDNNGVESSWKYYLGRAEAAAAQADQLGQEYLSASLSAQRDDLEGQRAAVATRSQVDQELETLQQICGISTSSDILLSLLGEGGDLGLLQGAQCSADIDCLDQTDQCIGNRCLKVPARLIASQETGTILDRLASCLGSDNIVPYVAVGNLPVCIHSQGDPCKLDDAYCPVPVVNGADPGAFCQTLNPSNPGDWVPVTNTLDFVTVPENVGYKQFKNERMEIGPGSSVECHYAKNPPPIQKSWFTINDWSGWKTNDPICGSQSGQSGCTHDHFCSGTGPQGVPAGYIAFQPWFKFPFYDPQGGDAGAGRSAEVTACPSSIDKADLVDLKPEMQIFLMKNAVQCNSSRIAAAMGTRILSQVPEQVVNVLRQQGPNGAFSAIGGDYAQAIADLRSNILARRDIVHAMGEEMEGMITDLDEYQSDLKELGLKGEEIGLVDEKLKIQRAINDIRLDKIELEADRAMFEGIVKITAAVAATVATAGAAAPAIGAAGLDLYLDLSSLGMDAQIIHSENQLLALDQKSNAVHDALRLVDAARKMSRTRESLRRRVAAISNYGDQMRSALEAWNGKLYEIESLRSKAGRALSRAVATASNQLAQQESRLVRVSSKVARLQQRRYDEAFRTAVGLSFLAKRAIEARLGVHFAEMTEKLPLLDAPPASWENDVCVAAGLNYNQIANTDDLPKGALNGFLGSYVAKLRNVVDAYQLRYAFHEGSDLMTVSLKDDVFRSRAECTDVSRNLLKETIAIDMAGPGAVGPLTATPLPPLLSRLRSSNWLQPGCAANQNCVWLGETTEFMGDFGVLRSTRPILLFAKGATLSQTLSVENGDYTLSWYQGGGRANSTVRVVDTVTGAVLSEDYSDSYVSHTHASIQWTRQVRGYHLSSPSTIRVDIVPGSGPATEYDWMQVGAIMLESVKRAAVGGESQGIPSNVFGASEFAGSDANGLSQLPCPDADGKVFREKYWRHECDSVCPLGTTAICPENQRIPRCYWEAPFALSAADIEQGRALVHAGFALGNYNYRIEDLAVNVVGSGLRDCSNTGTASCYASAYVPFSMAHIGPFTVRNHTGADVPVNIFTGRIEWAKALAAERYLTNPLSTTDSALLSQYTRQEFRGRPLDGNYVIRIWDDEDFQFDRVQDVQLLLRYRYWTAAR